MTPLRLLAIYQMAMAVTAFLLVFYTYCSSASQPFLQPILYIPFLFFFFSFFIGYQLFHQPTLTFITLCIVCQGIQITTWHLSDYYFKLRAGLGLELSFVGSTIHFEGALPDTHFLLTNAPDHVEGPFQLNIISLSIVVFLVVHAFKRAELLTAEK